MVRELQTEVPEGLYASRSALHVGIVHHDVPKYLRRVDHLHHTPSSLGLVGGVPTIAVLHTQQLQYYYTEQYDLYYD